MTEAPPREPAAPHRVLRRSSEGRFLMGVCAGLGRHTGIDPVVFRVGFAVLMLGSGIGLFLYIAAFLLMKEPNGKPGLIEQWTRRDFDADAVMALLAAVLACGLGINMATVWLDVGTLVVGVFLAVSLLAAHASGVDLLGLARSMPERLSRRRTGDGRPAPSYTPPRPTSPVRPQSAATGLGEPAAQETGHRPVQEPVHETTRHPVQEPAQETTRRPPHEPTREFTGLVSENAQESPPAGPARGHDAVEPDAALGDAVTAEHAVPPYQPPAHGRRQPRTAAYGDPFAPNGPYQPLDPARRAGGYSPYDPALYARPAPAERPRPARRPKSFIGVFTLLLAFIIGGIVMAAQARTVTGVSPTIVGGAMLITIGAGLLIAAWWGRGAGLVAAGTFVALLVGTGLMLGGVPSNVGSSEWTPASVAEASRHYDAGLGDGRLDLSELELAPGSTTTFTASVKAGELVVIVPPTARVEVRASNKVGDITLDQSVQGGVDVRVNEVLQPEVKPDGEPATLVLDLRSGVGDIEVRRGA
ncbi:PspC domain-containing protein [Nonomuraea sp. B10E15]|uniref:PspC domain-containing protein n=1 Tax=Nonomuraea sp. B10E15 TaxID=3153560 RepID=UPI00325F0F42